MMITYTYKTRARVSGTQNDTPCRECGTVTETVGVAIKSAKGSAYFGGARMVPLCEKCYGTIIDTDNLRYRQEMAQRGILV